FFRYILRIRICMEKVRPPCSLFNKFIKRYNKPGKKNTTNRNASNAPRPSKSPIDETIGSVDVHDKIKPTLDKIDADTPIEKIFSSMVFFTAASALISLRRYV